MAIKFIIFVTFAVSCVLAMPGYHPHSDDYYDHPHYSFNYGVTDHHTGDIKSQSEYRDGGVVKGQYSLVEPDGSIRTVDYTADDINGFNAVVTKTGPNVHAAKVVAPVVHKPVIAHKPVVVAPAPVVYKAAPAPLVTVAKSAQYTHHAPALNHYDYADYGHYDAGHYDAGHYY
ncbi:hypothetical protein PVAND_005593 [Polypedilum vanderplanki]|uniref:Cuticular protein n=1 Tax=Polypedilum vanderplanki TaxID=319348 RepID=A0A9J6C1D7_POLVA|nr:hypothetical protein PVAND_005593 [Polypedilum vanderplanki]